MPLKIPLDMNCLCGFFFVVGLARDRAGHGAVSRRRSQHALHRQWLASSSDQLRGEWARVDCEKSPIASPAKNTRVKAPSARLSTPPFTPCELLGYEIAFQKAIHNPGVNYVF